MKLEPPARVEPATSRLQALCTASAQVRERLHARSLAHASARQSAAVALDYRWPGKPVVVHVDQEWDYRVTVLALDFDLETFIAGLVDESSIKIIARTPHGG
ncbi:hypothetical protein [Micromonospora sp. KLBMP9576]|uniref:hypothetical protein n=1 Tax=Micromonospora sp. KLBMP9576 TaxID=3424769 RepID=UPI003D8B8050